MSMLDSFFNKGSFKAAKCKTLLKLTIPRIKLLRNRREIQIKQMRRDIAKLLENGQEATARIRVEHIIREENMMAAQEILELFSELISVRLPIIETQRECPLDLKEAISSLCFAAPRCADLPELLQVQMLFASKYGKEFASAASELMPDCGVNRQLIELLSVRAPSPETKLKLLKEIAEEHELDWDPAASETEFFKPHEDLLNGPTQFVSGSKLPLPKEKHDESLYSAPNNNNEQPDSDTGFDSLDFPEVPRVSLRPNANAASAPIMAPPMPDDTHHEIDHKSSKHSGAEENLSQVPQEPEEVIEVRSTSNKDEMTDTLAGAKEDKQFVPFMSRPSLSSASFSARPSNSLPSLSRMKSEANVDLQDVLAAAQAAAESAERAATAARTAASLAQVRIAELTKKKDDQIPESSCENPFYTDIHDQSATEQKPHIIHQNSLDESDDSVVSHQTHEDHQRSELPDPPSLEKLNVNPFYTDIHDQSATEQKPHIIHQNSLDESDDSVVSHQTHEDHQRSELPDPPSLEKLDVVFDAPLPNDHVAEQEPARHQLQRLTSVDDDSYYSYPNLFTSQNSDLGTGAHSFTDNSRSTHEL